jgi:hypothetical protein
VSIWRWVQEFRQEASDRGDEERLRMSLLLSQASPFFERDPDQALHILEEGRHLAQTLNEPRWVLFFTHWKLQVLFYYKRDYRAVLDTAVQATVTVSAPAFADFPQRLCLQEDLITACLKIDPLGHEDQIEQALAYMQREVTPDMECRHCVLSCRSEFDLACGRPGPAQETAARAVALAEEYRDEHQLSNAYMNLCGAAFAAGDFDNLGGWAEAGEEAARRGVRKSNLVLFLMWQAVARLRQGDKEAGRRLARTAVAQRLRLASQPDEGYYDALCAYHVLEGEVEKALKARERQLEAIADTGQLDQECRAHIERCRLLTLLGRRTDADLDAARTAARKLQKPEKYLAAIEQVAAAQ